METPYVGVAVNYSPHQSSQYLRIYQHLWNRRQVLSAIKLAIHVQLMVLNMVQPTWIGSYQQQSFPMRNIINIEVCYNTKHICKRASTVNSLPWSKFCYCLFRHNHPSYIWLLSLAFFYSTITPTLSTHKIGSIAHRAVVVGAGMCGRRQTNVMLGLVVSCWALAFSYRYCTRNNSERSKFSLGAYPRPLYT